MSPVGDVIRVHLTRDDYMSMPDDGKRYELLSGEMYVTPAPLTAHQIAIGQLHVPIESHVSSHGLGLVLLAPTDVVLSDDTVVQPDMLFVARERLAIVTDQCVEGAPDLVVEILSPSTSKRDLGVKLLAYARAGVRYYWTVDLMARTLVERELIGDAFRIVAEAVGGGTFQPRIFPDLAIDVDRLYRKP